MLGNDIPNSNNVINNSGGPLQSTLYQSSTTNQLNGLLNRATARLDPSSSSTGGVLQHDALNNITADTFESIVSAPQERDEQGKSREEEDIAKLLKNSTSSMKNTLLKQLQLDASKL